MNQTITGENKYLKIRNGREIVTEDIEKKRVKKNYYTKDKGMQPGKGRNMLKRKTHTHTFIARKSLDIFDESTVAYESIGRMTYTCQKCGALMFKGEKTEGSLSTENPTAKFSLCCSNGEIKLLPVKEPPETLKHLLTGNTKRE